MRVLRVMRIGPSRVESQTPRSFMGKRGKEEEECDMMKWCGYTDRCEDLLEYLAEKRGNKDMCICIRVITRPSVDVASCIPEPQSAHSMRDREFLMGKGITGHVWGGWGGSEDTVINRPIRMGVWAWQFRSAGRIRRTSEWRVTQCKNSLYYGFEPPACNTHCKASNHSAKENSSLHA